MKAADLGGPAPSGARLGRLLVSAPFVAFIVVLGIFLRAILYAADRSLTLDEAFLGLNLERRSAADLLRQLDWNSAAPPGFLQLEKLLTTLLGGSEHVLRAAPFVASLLGLILFARLSARLAGLHAAAISVLLFSILALTVSYAALAKPYAFDVLIVTSLYLLTIAVISDPGRSSRLFALALFGALAPAFSYASVFAVASSACLLVIVAIKGARQFRLPMLSVVAGWTALFLGWYVWRGNTVSDLQQSFGNEYLGSWSSIRNALGAIRIVLGISPYSAHLGTAVGVVATVGVAVFFFSGVIELGRRGWHVPTILLLPGVFAIIASAAAFYPVTPRTILFLAPALILCIAVGFVALISRVRSRRLFQGALIGLLLVVIASEAAASVHALGPVRGDDGMKPVMRALAANELPTDSVYLGYATQYPFAYYLECDCDGTSIRRAVRGGLWDVAGLAGGVDQWSPALRSRSPRILIGAFRGYGIKGYYRDFQTLQNRGRVWIVLSFLHERERHDLTTRLDQLGRRVFQVGEGSGVDGATAFLYVF
jgi:hypothetical protein